MSDFDTKADKNRSKIHRFLLSLVLQVVILSTVFAATVHDHYLAQWAIIAYSFLVVAGLLSFVVVSISSMKALAQTYAQSQNKWVFSLSPTGSVLRFISAIVSLIEIALLLTHGWLIIGTAWLLAEVFQFASIRRMSRAKQLVDTGEIEIDNPLENKHDNNQLGTLVSTVALPTDNLDEEKFNKKLEEKLTEIDKEFQDIDSQMRYLCSHNNGALPPEGSLNRKEYDELAARKEGLAEKIDQAILDAAEESKLSD